MQQDDQCRKAEHIVRDHLSDNRRSSTIRAKNCLALRDKWMTQHCWDALSQKPLSDTALYHVFTGRRPNNWKATPAHIKRFSRTSVGEDVCAVCYGCLGNATMHGLSRIHRNAITCSQPLYLVQKSNSGLARGKGTDSASIPAECVAAANSMSA